MAKYPQNSDQDGDNNNSASNDALSQSTQPEDSVQEGVTAQQKQKKLGLGMIIAMWAVVLFMLTGLFDKVDDHQRNPNQNVVTNVSVDGVREVVLQRNRQSHYVTSGDINGYEVEFMVDTGASDISIPLHVAEQIGLEKGPKIMFSTANGVAYGYATRLDSVAIGDIRLYNIRASINPNVGDMEILLGMSFLKHIEFTHSGNTLTLRQY